MTLNVFRRMLEKNVKKVGGLFNDKKRNEIADPSWDWYYFSEPCTAFDS